MPRSLPPRLVPALLVLSLALGSGCTSNAADPSATDREGDSAATQRSDSSAAALPPSRAGDARAAADYAQALTGVLSQVVTDEGRVRYDLLRGKVNGDFRRVLKAVEDHDATALQTQNEKLAFWINAYNVQMLANVLEAWPVRDVSAHDEAFFNQPLRTAGTALSLDQIESVILRRQDGPQRAERFQVPRFDPRVHAAVNCAARSCPRLRRQAFTPQTVDAMLTRAMQGFTGSPRQLRRTPDGFALNSIVKWYGSDFGRTGKAAGDYLLSFMPEERPDYAAFRRLLEGRSAKEIQQRPDVSFHYDWTLNATGASLPGPASS